MTNDKLRHLAQMINDRYELIAAQMQSEDYQPDPVQLERWKRLGLVPENVTAETFMISVPTEMHLIRNAFILGRLADAVEQGETLEQIMHLALSMPLKKPDLAAIAVAEQQTATYIRNYAGDIATEAGKLWAAKQSETVRNMAIEYHRQTLKETVLDAAEKEAAGLGVEAGQVNTWQKFASELHHAMDDKARDWQRVAYTELTDAQKQGEAHRQMEQYGADELVYKMPMPTACAQCLHAYLLPDGKTPRIFRVSDLLLNGNNVGRKPHPTKGGKVAPGGRLDGAETMKPVAGTMHPYCQCQGVYQVTGYEPWLTDKQKVIVEQHKTVRKSQMAFDFDAHHVAYDRTDPRTGKLEHIEAKGQQHGKAEIKFRPVKTGSITEHEIYYNGNAVGAITPSLDDNGRHDGYEAYFEDYSYKPQKQIYSRSMNTIKQMITDHLKQKFTVTPHHIVQPPSAVVEQPQQEETMQTDLKEQLEAHKPILEDQFKSNAAHTLLWLKKMYGAGMNQMYNQASIANSNHYKTWEALRGSVYKDEHGEYHINEVAIDQPAAEYANATVAAWLDKIMGKVKDLQNSKVHHLNGNRFIISGERDGKKVSIEQDMIINRSSNNLLFNQFPARIYVDGKFHSEAAYKKLTGDDAVEKIAKEKAAAEKRIKNMLPSGIFAKGDEVKLRLKRKNSGESYETYGKVTGERNGKTIVRVSINRFNNHDYGIETEKLARWNQLEPPQPPQQ